MTEAGKTKTACSVCTSNIDELDIWIFCFYIKRVPAKGKKISIKKIPLVARPCKEDSRRNKDMWG